jgi:hypothetical protein
MMQDQPTPQLHIDSDWKAQAQAEKERLAQKEQEKAGSKPGPDEMPPPDFKGVIGMLAYQAMSGLGIMADQRTGRVVVDLVGSRYYIDLLSVLEQKTKGNLTPEESKELTQVLAELRSRFVQLAQLVAQQAPDLTAEPKSGPAPAAAAAPTPKSKIILEP